MNGKRPPERREAAPAFTLVELLTVIAIIGILAALLLPALAGAKARAFQAQCLSNQRQIGVALKVYAMDSAEVMPLLPDWNGLNGQDGTYDVFVAATNRPLNEALGRSDQVSKCPADHGDNYYAHPTPPGKSCWDMFGTSYLPQWSYSVFGVQYIFGQSSDPLDFPSSKGAVIDRHPVNKIIQGDWNWHPNRGNADPRSLWHNHRGQSLSIVLWGDNHVSALSIPANTDANMIANPGNSWW